MLPDIRHVCDAFQHQLTRRALEVLVPLVDQVTKTYRWCRRQSSNPADSRVMCSVESLPVPAMLSGDVGGEY